MSVDCLQEKIRKLKNPSMLQISAQRAVIPYDFLDSERSIALASARYSDEILRGLQGMIPAVRFSFSSFSLLGNEGLQVLSELCILAKELGYYVVMDGPAILSSENAEMAASILMNPDSQWPCDGLLVLSYIGSDSIQPFLPYLHQNKKDLFVVSKTPNKTSGEIQDLLSGQRLVHTAMTDIVNRLGEPYVEKCGYSSLGVVYSAIASESLKIARQQHKETFFIIDGYDYPNANCKNCSFGFDQLGHGAVVCASSSILAAWKKQSELGISAVAAAVEAAERMRKNILRYITVL